ncbi:MAG: CDP-alcohol phosphatidyltransferase family protein [Planctomycetes bacterium]|nr:CDP-alcohol phosphatidyltransferase family protein [Planctomycetota bacterium]
MQTPPHADTSAPTQQEPLLSLPNLLTLVRVPLAGAVWLVAPWPWALIGVMFAAGLSDVLDGWFARRMRARRLAHGLPTRSLGEKGGRGAWLDPVVDKLFVVSTLAAVLVFYAPPWWWLPLIATRECIQLPLVALYKLTPGLARRLRFDFRAGMAGKLATVSQFAAVWVFILGGAHWLAFALLAGAVGLIAALDYVLRALAHSRD